MLKTVNSIRGALNRVTSVRFQKTNSNRDDAANENHTAQTNLNIEERRRAMINAMSSGNVFKSVRLTETEIRELASRQASRLDIFGDEGQENSKLERASSQGSFRDLPPVSTMRRLAVVLVTVIAAPACMLLAHVTTRQCWDAETTDQGLEACGEPDKAKFVKPWFLLWATYIGQMLCLLAAMLENRNAKPQDDDMDGSSLSLFDRAASEYSDTTNDTKRVLLCGCCCGYQIYHNPEEAAEDGIKVKPYREAVIGTVPVLSQRDGSPFRWKHLSYSWKILHSLFPAATDLTTTALTFLSLLYIPPSLTVMFKSLSIVWVTIFSPLVLPGRAVSRAQYFAVVIALAGAGLIGTSAMMQEASESQASEDGSAEEEGEGQRPAVVVGILCAVLAGLSTALSSISMEKIMVELDVDASTLVGITGLMDFVVASVALVVFHFLPGGDHGSIENVLDTIHMLGDNWKLLSLMALYATVGSGLNNWAFGEATRVLSSVTMMLIRNICTFLLWGCELLLFYCIAGDRLGSQLFVAPGLIKLVGFAFTSFALTLYLGFVRLPFPCLYPDADSDSEADSDQKLQAPVSSSSLASSPFPSSDAVSAAEASAEIVLSVSDGGGAGTPLAQHTTMDADGTVNSSNAPPRPLLGLDGVPVGAPSVPAAPPSIPLSLRPSSQGSRLRRANALRLSKHALQQLKRKVAHEYVERRRLSLW